MLRTQLFFIFLLSFFSQPVYGIFGIRLVIPWDPWKKEEIDIHSRKYLYEIIKHSPNFILTKEVKENREYYIQLIEQHLEVLNTKLNQFNYAEYKNYSIGALSLAAAMFTSRVLIVSQNEITALRKLLDDNGSHKTSWLNHSLPSNEKSKIENQLSIQEARIFVNGPLMFFFSYLALTRLYKAMRYKAKVQKRIDRDMHVLKLLKQN